MAITKLTKHNSHQMSIRRCKTGSMHYAALRCVSCNCHIQWLSKQDFFSLMGTDINNNNYNINDNKNIIISVGKADTDNDQSLRDSLGQKQAKGESPDSKGVVSSRPRTYWQRRGYTKPPEPTKLRKFLESLNEK